MHRNNDRDDVGDGEENSEGPDANFAGSGTTMVSVGKMPGALREVDLSSLSIETVTVADLFRRIEISVEGCEIQCNGKVADLDDLVEGGDTVLAFAKIKGN
ncbi:MAG: hypothetical protein Q8P82_00670 [bacterium]|nr:hypothetical protein [bacterium]